MQVVGCDDGRSNLKVRGVQAPVCKPLLSVGEYTTMGGVTVLLYCMVTKVTCFTKVRMLQRKLMLGSRVQRKQRVQHLLETKRKQD